MVATPYSVLRGANNLVGLIFYPWPTLASFSYSLPFAALKFCALPLVATKQEIIAFAFCVMPSAIHFNIIVIWSSYNRSQSHRKSPVRDTDWPF